MGLAKNMELKTTLPVAEAAAAVSKIMTQAAKIAELSSNIDEIVKLMDIARQGVSLLDDLGDMGPVKLRKDIPSVDFPYSDFYNNYPDPNSYCTNKSGSKDLFSDPYAKYPGLSVECLKKAEKEGATSI